MKTKIFGCLFAATVLCSAASLYHTNVSEQEPTNQLIIDNIEALSSGESGSGTWVNCYYVTGTTDNLWDFFFCVSECDPCLHPVMATGGRASTCQAYKV